MPVEETGEARVRLGKIIFN